MIELFMSNTDPMLVLLDEGASIYATLFPYIVLWTHLRRHLINISAEVNRVLEDYTPLI